MDLLPHHYDLSAYGARIGYTGPWEPTLPVLEALASHHARSIPFENLDVMLGRGIDLAPAALEQKLVRDRRGGYCFEHNGLMLGILRQVGFTVRPQAARVRLEMARDFLPPRTHLFLVVMLDEVEWLFDVGVGSASLTRPIRFQSRDEQPTPHEKRRLVVEGGCLFHQWWNGSAWADVYQVTGEEMPVIDREVANWWTSTNPNSKFRKALMAAIAGGNGERFGLLKTRFIHRRGPEILEEIQISSETQLREILARVFGIVVPKDAVIDF